MDLYEELRQLLGRLETAGIEDGQVSVVSREGLITLKLAAGRPQDLVDVQNLQAGD